MQFSCKLDAMSATTIKNYQIEEWEYLWTPNYGSADYSIKNPGVKGRDSVAGLTKTLNISSQEIREALLETVQAIVETVREALERCPPELSADLVDRGMILAGGGALVRGLDKFISEKTGLPVIVAVVGVRGIVPLALLGPDLSLIHI